MDAFPRGSNGSNSARPPAPMMSAPATKTGTAVLRFAYSAIMGACHIRPHANVLNWLANNKLVSRMTHQDAEYACRSCGKPVSRAAVVGREHFRRGRIQHTVHNLQKGKQKWAHELTKGGGCPPMSGSPTLLKNAYPQFHPSNSGELRAVVLANRIVPVSTAFTPCSLSKCQLSKDFTVLARGGSQSPAAPDEWKLDGPSGDKRTGYTNYGNYDLLCALVVIHGLIR